MNKIRLLFSGDFAPVMHPGKISTSHFEDLETVFADSDLHLTNLECPLTNSTKPIEKTGPSIKADPRAVKLLKQAGVNVACMANNHILDFGEEGVRDTIEICKANNIKTLGIRPGDGSSGSSLVIEIKGKKIGVLNYCEHEFSVRKKGFTGAAGYDPVDAYYEIKQLRECADYIIVIYHGGNEYYDLPRPDLKKDFHFMADLGADAVIGHHTHVISGYEVYKGKPLVYSLGNFFFPFDGEPESWHRGILCRLVLGSALEIDLIPFSQCYGGYEVSSLIDKQKDVIMERIEELSVIITDEIKLNDKWMDFCNTSGAGFARQLLYPTIIDKVILRLPLIKRIVEDRRQFLAVLNMLRCKSLRQAIIDNLISRQ